MKIYTVANQVFIGCPWNTVRPKYEKIIKRFKVIYPLSFIIVGRGEDQRAEDLLQKIKDRLFQSSEAIFDATNGNANVSLEYGMAEVQKIPRSIFISQHKASTKKPDQAIIADLSGKVRVNYKQASSLQTHLGKFCRNHSYTKRFESFLRRHTKSLGKGPKKSIRALALKIIHELDEKESQRRSDIVQNLAVKYKEQEINKLIKGLSGDTLISCTEGRYSYASIR